MFIRDWEQKHYEPACNAIRDFVGKKFSFKRSDQEKHYHKTSLLTHPDAGGDEEFCKTINRAYQILTNDAAREAYIFGLDEAEKDEATNFLYSKTFT